MTVSEQIIEVLDALCEKFGITIDWTADNVLPYMESLCTKLISWEILTSVYWICLLTILTLIGFFVMKKVHTKCNEVNQSENFSRCQQDDWETINVIVWVCFIVLLVVSVVMIAFQVHDIITCVTFPEMMLIEKIQSLMSTTG